MNFTVKKSEVGGTVIIPGSKSHTIRAFFFAALADGESIIDRPLLSDDTKSAITASRLFGAEVTDCGLYYKVKGFGSKPSIPDNIIDVGNSGTTLRIALSIAALTDGWTFFTGDHQIRNRPVGPVIEALNNLGAQAFTSKNNGKAPAAIRGPAKGGFTKLDGLSSQFLTSILVSAPLFSGDTEIELTRLNEIPYVEITTWWLDKFNIKYTKSPDYMKFTVKGGQSYKPFKQTIPADFSTATFFIVLAAISGGEFKLKNLDMTDPQGDKEVLNIIKKMGATVTINDEYITVKGGKLKGIEIDMNAIPDALPALAVAGCFAEGETKLYNVLQARYKETDRIKVMCTELKKMGADIEELEDGLIIRNSKLKGTSLSGHHDHRVVMSLAIAGLCCDGETTVDTAEAAGVTVPEFFDIIKSCGGNISKS